MKCNCGICKNCQGKGLSSLDGVCRNCDNGTHLYEPKREFPASTKGFVSWTQNPNICGDCGTEMLKIMAKFGQYKGKNIRWCPNCKAKIPMKA